MTNLLTNRYLYETKTFEEEMGKITISLDMDATCIEHRYPKMGKELPYCVETLQRWVEKYNVGLILTTMRSGKLLDDAVKWFAERNIPLYGIQKHPTQEDWTESPKCHADYCIDDRNVGQPLTLDEEGVPCVDWKKTVEIFEPVLEHINNLRNATR